MDVNVLVGIGIAAACRPPEPRGAPDQRLVESLPERLRPHEGLVVEAGGEEARQPPARRADVELEARPSVLADRDEPVMEFDHGGAQVRLVPVSLADADQRVHLFRPEADDAARPVILEAAPHQAPAVGEQRRCEAVARMSGERPSVEAEGDAPRPVDPSPGGVVRDPVGLAAHGSTSLDLRCGREEGRPCAARRPHQRLGRQLRDAVEALELHGHRVARRMEPLAAAPIAAPALEMQPARIVPQEQIVGLRRIRDGSGSLVAGRAIWAWWP